MATPNPSDAEVDAVIEEFGGDPREAIRALLHDLDVMARSHERTVSRGYVRGLRVLRGSGGAAEDNVVG